MDDTLIAKRSLIEEASPLPTRRQAFEVLQELTRHGYAPDSQPPAGRGIRLRHPVGPDLLLREDGTVEVPIGQPLRGIAVASVPEARPRKRIFWGRGLLFLVLLALTTFFSLMLMVGLLGG